MCFFFIEGKLLKKDAAVKSACFDFSLYLSRAVLQYVGKELFI